MVQRRFSVTAGVKAASRVGVALAAVALLAGCGQKGALALGTPVTAAAPVAPPASAASASAR